jgi:hypothetical protein
MRRASSMPLDREIRRITAYLTTGYVGGLKPKPGKEKAADGRGAGVSPSLFLPCA